MDTSAKQKHRPRRQSRPENVQAGCRPASIFNAAIGKICRKDVRNFLCGQVLSFVNFRQLRKIPHSGVFSVINCGFSRLFYPFVCCSEGDFVSLNTSTTTFSTVCSVTTAAVRRKMPVSATSPASGICSRTSVIQPPTEV